MTAGSLLHLGRRALGDLAAEVHRDDLVGDAHHHRHVVLDEQHGEPELVADAPDRLAELVDLAVGEARRRLVDAAGTAAGRPAPGRSRGASACRRADRRRAGRRGGRGRAAPAGRRPRRGCACSSRPAPMRSDRPDEADRALAVGADHHVLEQRHRREQRQVLERAGDAEARRCRGPGRRAGRARRRCTLPARRLVDAADDVEHRRLAGAVRPDQPADVALAMSNDRPSRATMPPKRTVTSRTASSAAPVVRHATLQIPQVRRPPLIGRTTTYRLGPRPKQLPQR